MVPVMWLSLRRGARVGVITGVIFGMLALPIDAILLGASSIIATPVQVVLEYPVAFGMIGLTGLFRNKSALSGVPTLLSTILERLFRRIVRLVISLPLPRSVRAVFREKFAHLDIPTLLSTIQMVAGAGFSVFVRFWIHYFVGVFVWSSVYAFPAQYGLWIWPAVYNGSFLAADFAICAILLFALVKRGTLRYGL
jgi:thiamine transporter ThiT